jgi:hypothetical protein
MPRHVVRMGVRDKGTRPRVQWIKPQVKLRQVQTTLESNFNQTAVIRSRLPTDAQRQTQCETANQPGCLWRGKPEPYLSPQAIVQNPEQQLKGRERFLAWDLQGILNFMLSRVSSSAYQVFSTNFLSQVSLIRNKQLVIAEAAVRADEINDALKTFKSLGLFKDRPGFEGAEWRAGRIFRSALRMKLRR